MHHRNAEPNLEEALYENLVQAMMKADRVDPRWRRALVESVARVVLTLLVAAAGWHSLSYCSQGLLC